MKKKAAIFCCCIIVLAVGSICFNNGFPRWSWQGHRRPVDINFHFDPDSVNECVVKAGGRTIEMKRVSGRWLAAHLFDGIPIDQSFIPNYLSSLKQVKLTEFSDSVHFDPAFGLQVKADVEMILSGEGTVQEHLVFSFKDVEPGKVFIYRQGVPGVFLCDENILHSFGVGAGRLNGLSVDPWLDKRPADIDVSAVAALIIREKGKVHANLRRDAVDHRWHFAKGYLYAVDIQRVQSYVQMVNGLQGIELVPAQDVAWTPKDWTLTLTFNNGTATVLRRVQDDQENFYLHAEGRPFAVKVSANHFHAFDHNDGSFFADNPLGIDHGLLRDIRFNRVKAKVKGLVSREAEGSIWKNSRKEVVGLDAIVEFIEAVKNLRLKTVVQPLKRTAEIMSVAFRQGNIWRELRLRDSLILPDKDVCYPVSFDQDPKTYCLDSVHAGRLVAGISALVPAKPQAELP